MCFLPGDVTLDFLVLADRHELNELEVMCVDEYVMSGDDVMESVANLHELSERLKLLVLQKKLARLSAALDKEKKYKTNVETKLTDVAPQRKWSNKFILY